uniref:Uncharacterized protein n=1 Tax=Trypanosoma congolense (strain IL3000) TaxID=1068625 RepID=G0UNS0_TRYCI|nr:conserved hypothetical protein [Trypanosoma congolense IL3000]
MESDRPTTEATRAVGVDVKGTTAAAGESESSTQAPVLEVNEGQPGAHQSTPDSSSSLPFPPSVTSMASTTSGETGGGVSVQKLSQRAFVGKCGWEPVVKPPDGDSAIPLAAAPTADVVWLNDTTSVTLIPNNNDGGVRTRRAAASLAVVSPPTSYLVYTRDPLIKVRRTGQKDVHVVSNLTPGGDPRSVLKEVPLTSFSTTGGRRVHTRNSAAAEQGENEDNKSDSNTASRIEDGINGESGTAPPARNNTQRHVVKIEKETVAKRVKREVEVNEDLCDDSGECSDDKEQYTAEDEESNSGAKTNDGEENGNMKNKSSAVNSSRSRRRRGLVGWLSRRRSRFGCEKKRRRPRRKDPDDPDGQETEHHRIGVLSAAQAMLPPPYRRSRRLKRKLDITEDTPIFAVHSELRDKMPHLFAKAPFSTDEDVLRSTIDWRDNPTLLYARMLWGFAPYEFLEHIRKQKTAARQ